MMKLWFNFWIMMHTFFKNSARTLHLSGLLRSWEYSWNLNEKYSIVIFFRYRHSAGHIGVSSVATDSFGSSSSYSSLIRRLLPINIVNEAYSCHSWKILWMIIIKSNLHFITILIAYTTPEFKRRNPSQ